MIDQFLVYSSSRGKRGEVEEKKEGCSRAIGLNITTLRLSASIIDVFLAGLRHFAVKAMVLHFKVANFIPGRQTSHAV